MTGGGVSVLVYWCIGLCEYFVVVYPVRLTQVFVWVKAFSQCLVCGVYKR